MRYDREWFCPRDGHKLRPLTMQDYRRLGMGCSSTEGCWQHLEVLQEGCAQCDSLREEGCGYCDRCFEMEHGAEYYFCTNESCFYGERGVSWIHVFNPMGSFDSPPGESWAVGWAK